MGLAVGRPHQGNKGKDEQGGDCWMSYRSSRPRVIQCQRLQLTRLAFCPSSSATTVSCTLPVKGSIAVLVFLTPEKAVCVVEFNVQHPQNPLKYQYPSKYPMHPLQISNIPPPNHTLK